MELHIILLTIPLPGILPCGVWLWEYVLATGYVDPESIYSQSMSTAVLYCLGWCTETMVVANQWYWVYTSSDSSLFLYAVREQELGIGDLRLLHTTQLLIVDG